VGGRKSGAGGGACAVEALLHACELGPPTLDSFAINAYSLGIFITPSPLLRQGKGHNSAVERRLKREAA